MTIIITKYLKIIFLAFTGFMFLSNSFANALIKNKYDDFSEETTYVSELMHYEPWWNVAFLVSKDKSNRTNEISLAFMMVQSEWFFFSEQYPLAMKIDGEIMKIDNFDTRSDMISAKKLATASFYMLNIEQIKRINRAKNIILRVPLKNKPDITWEVPDHVLIEWKELFKESGLFDN